MLHFEQLIFADTSHLSEVGDLRRAVWRIRGISSDLFGIPADRIAANSSPESIEQWDSIQHLNLVLAIEERFNLQSSPEEIEQMKNMEQIAKIVEEKLGAVSN